jgi:hypothetical protein
VQVLHTLDQVPEALRRWRGDHSAGAT